jgi:hypothetical protein
MDAERVPTGASLASIEEDRVHKQDWTIITDEKDTWANRERRRSSVWAKLEVPKSPTSPTNVKNRRGSILSVWSAGKDKHGKDVLIHDGSESDSEKEEEVPLEKTMSATSDGSQGKQNPRTDRRGSILSLWSQGKDASGRNVILHDDDEWEK